jgi:hypothetical protein
VLAAIPPKVFICPLLGFAKNFSEADGELFD